MKAVAINLIFIFSFLAGFGQDAQKTKNLLLIGGTIGINKTTVKGLLVDNHISFNGRTRGKINDRNGLNISLILKYNFGKYGYFKTGVGYFEKGAFVESQLIQDFNAQVNYLNVPILFGLQFPLDNQISLALESGISFNDKIGCKGDDCLDLEDTFTLGPTPGPQLLTTKSPVDFSIGALIEYTLPNRNRLFVSYRHFRDFTYFYGSDKDLRFAKANKPYADFTATHQGYSLNIGILFPVN